MSDQTPPWTVCEVHSQHTDPDCDYCQKQLEGQQSVLSGMQEAVQDINRKLTGITNQPFVETSTSVPMLKVEVMAAMIFSDPKARMALELNFTNALIGQMNEVHKLAVRQQIMGR